MLVTVSSSSLSVLSSDFTVHFNGPSTPATVNRPATFVRDEKQITSNHESYHPVDDAVKTRKLWAEHLLASEASVRVRMGVCADEPFRMRFDKNVSVNRRKNNETNGRAGRGKDDGHSRRLPLCAGVNTHPIELWDQWRRYTFSGGGV